MKDVLAGAGRRFIHAVLAALIVLSVGVVNATSPDQMYGLGLVFLIAAAAALLKFVQEVLPWFSWASLGVPQPVAAWLDAFTQAAAGTLIVALPAVFDSPDLATARVLALAAIQGALTAGFRALEGMLTKGESPGTSHGF